MCKISLELIGGFSLNIHRCATRTSLRADKILVTLTSFSSSQEDLNMFIFTKIVISLKPLTCFHHFSILGFRTI